MNLFTSLLLLFPILIWSTELKLNPEQKQIMEEVSWGVKLLLLKRVLENEEQSQQRRVGVQAYVMAKSDRRQGDEPMPSEDTDMKMKLFRLMYETVRDSDLKVKRAELINAFYVNSSSFEVGFLMGDITDKFGVMSDIAVTLKRLYNTWKPLEHINAYEQIANQAIETSHLIDLVRAVGKKQELDAPPSPPQERTKKST